MNKIEIKCFEKLDMYKPKAKDRLSMWIKGFCSNKFIYSFILLIDFIIQLPFFAFGLIVLVVTYPFYKLHKWLCAKLF